MAMLRAKKTFPMRFFILYIVFVGIVVIIVPPMPYLMTKKLFAFCIIFAHIRSKVPVTFANVFPHDKIIYRAE